MIIRNAVPADATAAAKAEMACFPAAEAASLTAIRDRIAEYPDRFWIMDDNGKIAAYVNGMTTNEPDLKDEMYENTSLHDKNGQWQMIFSVGTLPEYRGTGCASKLLQYVIDLSRNEGKKGLVLTCKNQLIDFYSRFGFIDEGISDSKHGGVTWHKMRLTL